MISFAVDFSQRLEECRTLRALAHQVGVAKAIRFCGLSIRQLKQTAKDMLGTQTDILI